MKKRVITIGVLMMSGLAFSQVGIGVRAPHKSALLEVKASEGDYRGVLIPRIPLKSLTDKSFINKGDVAESLLVFNTTTKEGLAPGFYYWKGTEWVRLLNNQDVIDNIDNFPRNKVLGVEGESLVLTDTKGHTVNTPIKDLNIVTTIKDNKDGTYTYTNEAGVTQTIDISGSVINNITTILQDETVINEIYNNVAAKGKELKTADSSILVEGGLKAVLNETKISVANKGITTAKLSPGGNKQLLITDATGQVKWVSASDEVIKEAIKLNEKVTILQNNQDGTFVYYNENGIDENGGLIQGKGVFFDANTLRIEERKGEKGKGIFDFYDGKTTKDKPLMTISTRANSIVFENDNSVIEGDNLQDVINNIIAKIEIAQGKPADIKGKGILINDNAVLAGAVLKEVMLSIADNAISETKIVDGAVTSYKLRDGAVIPEKIAPGKDKYILVTKNKKVEWVPATDQIIQDVVKQNETVTVLNVNPDGTFTYQNEDDIKKGNPGVEFDANTLSISDDGKGKYVFTDGKGPLATIDIKGTVITNIDEILNNTTVQNTIFKTVAANGQKLEAEDTSIQITGGDKAVLANTKISVAPKGISTDKIEPGTDKYLLVTKDGEVEWVPATDSIIQDVVKQNETVTVLNVNPDGTFTYRNEDDIKNGGAGVVFNANTLKIVEQNGKKGVYVFYDGQTSLTAPLMTIDVAGTVIENINEILNDTTVQNNIYNTVAAKGKAVTSPGTSIAIGGEGDKAVLNEMTLDIAVDGVSTEMIQDKAVTPAKLQGGTVGQLLVTNVNNEAKWVDATDEVIKEFLKGNQAITELVDLGTGQFTYFNEADYDADGNRKPGATGITFDANTLRIDEVKGANGKGNGVYNFYDKSKDTPIGTVNVTQNIIDNITTIFNSNEVKNEVIATINSSAKSVTSTDQSIAVTGGDKATLQNVIVTIAEKGVKTKHIADGQVTSAKISSEGAVKGTVLTADGLGKASFATATETVAPAMRGNLVGEEEVIKVEGGNKVLYGDDNKNVKVSIVAGGITSAHIKNETIENNDIKNKTIQAGKLDATGAKQGAVATVNADGTVSYLPVTSATISNKGDIATTDGISVDDGTGKVLGNVTLGLADGQVAPTKLTPGKDNSLLVTKAGKAQWVEATDDIIKDIVNSKETITVLKNEGKGIYTYFNEEAVKNNTAGVAIDVNSLSIDSSNPGVYVFKDLSSDNPLATINIATDVINSIVTILGDTDVKTEVYNIIAAQGKAITSTDGSLAIPVGNKAGLEGLNIGIATDGVKTTHIADKQITAAKLVADGTNQEGFVATVNGDGTVSYKSVIDTDVSSKAAALKTDNIIQVDGVNSKGGVLFSEATLSIREGGIDTTQLADNAVDNSKIAEGAVTIDKISAGPTDKKKVMVTDDNGVVKWGELDDIVTDAAGNLTTDNIIEITVGDGVNSLFNNVGLGIADKSITKTKLSSADETSPGTNIAKDRILVTDGIGGFDYVTKDAVLQGGKDLKLGSTLEFTQGDGLNALLVETHIDVVDQGIGTGKLADGAVTITKMSSETAAENSVLTADGQGNVAYKKISESAFEGSEADLISDGSLAIPLNNKAVLKATTIGIGEKGVQTKHIADENVTVAKVKGGAAKQLLITNEGGKAQWVDASDPIIKEIVKVNEQITVLTDNQDGTFTYQNEEDIANGSAGITFNANTLTITDNGKGEYVFTDKSGTGALATIDIQATIINNITELLQDVNVKEEIYNIIAGQGKKVSEGDAIAIIGGDKAALEEMTIGLKDGGVTTAKISSTGADKNTVLTADGQGNVAYVKLSESAFEGKGANLTSDGSLVIPEGEGSVLKATTIGIAPKGVKSEHIADKNVTTSKISSDTLAAGRVLTTDGNGGAEFQTLREVLGDHGKALIGDTAIHVEGGDHATLNDVKLTLNNNSITNEKLALNAVANANIQEGAVTAGKIAGEKQRTILITDEYGTVRWADANANVIEDIVGHTESLTVLRDNNDGTFTYFAENQVDNKGNIKDGAVGVTFNANTLSIDNSTPGIYVLKDKSKANNGVVGTIDTRASHIIFEGDVSYTSVEEAITNITQKIEQLEKIEIDKEGLSGDGILVNGKASEEDVLLKKVNLSIADDAITTSKIADEHVTPQKIKAGNAKQLLVTNAAGKAEWVDATDAIAINEKITLLTDNQDGTFTYQNEDDIANGGSGVKFDANTLKIEVIGKGKYEFYDKSQDDPLATIDVTHDVIENILEIIKEVNVQEEIYKVIAAKGKAVSTDNSIQVVGGEQAALHEMTISLRDEGVTAEKIKAKAVTEDKLFAGANKKDYVPVVQSDGSVKYQPMSAVVAGEMLTVDSSLKITGDASKAVLQKMDLEVNEGGIETKHLHNLSVTTDKISSKQADVIAKKGDILAADGSGNAAFYSSNEIIKSANQGDLIGESGVIAVKGGENVLFGDETKQAEISIRTGGIKGGDKGHIAAGTIQNSNIANQSITATKLNAEAAQEGAVATVGAGGTVSYQPITTTAIVNKGEIKTDNIISVDNGVDKVFADVMLGLNDNSVTPAKLSADGAATGTVATVGANGLVSYQPISTHVISNKGSLTTDEVIVVDNGVDKLLGDMRLSIKNKGITNDQLADKSVTAENISSKGIQAKSVLISGSEDNVFWGELKDIVTNTAGNLTTDDIIEMTKGDGVNSLLADVALGIKDNSITRDKLSSIEGGAPVGKDKILVTNDAGGFDLVDQNAVQVGGKDLALGGALAFTKGDGLNTVLVETGIDVKASGITNDKIAPSAVTVDKISAGEAAANTVLTSVGQGKVEYKALSNTAFEGQGVDLESDASIVVTENNKALLKAANIAIAKEGVDSKHLKAKSVTTDKISSVNGKNNYAAGTFLAADGQGATSYQTMDKIASTQGKSITSTGNSLAIEGNKAALQDINIEIAKDGVKTNHIADRQVTIDKIGSGENGSGLLLATNGQGGAEFIDAAAAISDIGKPLGSGTGITITGGGKEHALLGDATVNISEKGVGEAQLADSAVTTSKIAIRNVTSDKLSSKEKDKVVDKGKVLTADGKGGVEYASPAGATTTGELIGSEVINVVNGKGAVLSDVQLDIVQKSIKGIHIEDGTITTSKIGKEAIKNGQIAANAVGRKEIYPSNIDEEHMTNNSISSRTIQANAVTTQKIADEAVTNEKIQNLAIDNFKIKNATISGGKLIDGAIEEKKIKDGAVTKAKISAAGETVGHVLTVESGGKVAFKAPTGTNVSKGELKSGQSIDVLDGKGAVLSDVTISVKKWGIDTDQLAGEAVGTDELKGKSVTDEKISSHGAPIDEVLTSDGKGGAFWAPVKGGNSNKAAMPKFFYAPSFYVSVEPGESATINVYGVYEEQFGTPMKVNPNAQTKSLPVLGETELDYYVLYYDEDVFSDVEMLDNGRLKYKVKSGVRTTTETYFNIAFGVRD
ncbi:hypothetical protein [Myroides odoratimimus]|uniref:beta strand repeat-containing protein n=1 Tax=Myroides odoratimimus TaxID=76832 RepID=UPI003100C80E